ncbi:RNA helicase [Lottiidibacillus patelloidae]|uniref:ATP-dependent RNA helicase CshA n=1 Tax=Lottiidibacillus patelloidae TaxID=2670334 RepID=A0A263BY95_9BACI|nr:DEAD/DEAH box helicase [Lottiidibacillus patelloidae]OZM58640.1 RNA helicase [Lottiidibacillus patelloidae]
MTTGFTKFNIAKDITNAIEEMGFEQPSPIQEKVIPVILEKVDVIGQAQTGTGKTAAFGIPLIEKTTPKNEVQAIVLTPTRELAMQVAGEIQKIAKHKRTRVLPIYGGQSIEMQIKALKRGVQIVIGTPGRVLDHLRRKTLKLDKIHTFILDEADEMLNMGFISDIEEIIGQANNDRQTLLFSATMPHEIKRLARNYMKSPRIVSATPNKVTATKVDQVYYQTFDKNKVDTLCRILDSNEIDLGIIFSRTKKGVAELTESLQARGYVTDGLHGDLTQMQRDKVMNKFRMCKIDFLIATDVAARGIDVENVTHVINYDIPQDPESYVHRIGRTGRAGRQGIAITLVTPAEMKHLRSIESEIGMPLEQGKVPTMKEVVIKRSQVWKKQIIETINKGEADDAFTPLINELLENHEPKDVLHAMMKLAFSYDGIEEEPMDFGDTGGKPGMVRFFLNVGRSANLQPKMLAEEIAKSTGISAHTVGRIDMFDKFTFFEIPKEPAPFVYESLKQTRLNGMRIFIQPAKPRNS